MANIELIKQIKTDAITKAFEGVLGKNANAYVTSLISVINGNPELQKCDRNTIIGAAMKAATLQLPIDANLGFAYIIGYANRKTGKTDAQFQIGYKGFIQLALRSGQISKINATPIYEGQLLKFNPLTEDYEFDFMKKSDKIIGYAGYLEFTNGFSKTTYWTVEKVEKHAKTYSQTYKKGFGVWADNFEKMALKTVIKSILSTFAVLSVDIQEAIKFDQSVIKTDNEANYIDFESVTEDLPEDVLETAKINLTNDAKV